MEPEPRLAVSEAIGTVVSALPSEARFAAERQAARQLLGCAGAGPIKSPHGGTSAADVLAKLSQLFDKDVLPVLVVVMAETLAGGTVLIDTLAAAVAKHWQSDNLFFDLVRNREAVQGMLGEVIGVREADGYLTATGTKTGGIRMALSGTNREKVEGWLPRYVRFPSSG